MRFKKLAASFLFYLFSTLLVFSQDTTRINPKDTIAYSEENSEKIIAFGKAIEASISNDKPDVFNSKWFKKAFFKYVLDLNQSTNADDVYTKGFFKGVEKGLIKFPKEIITEVQNGSYYDFVNYRYDTTYKTYYVLFRLYSPESGINYHDYRVKEKGGELYFTDIYIYMTGENLTSTMSRMLSYTLPQKRLFGLIEPAQNEDVKDLLKAINLKNAGKFAESYTVLENIKSKITNDKFFMIFKSLIASYVDEDKYLASLEELISKFPDDQTIALNKVDYLIYKNKYFEAIQVVNQLQNETDDDFLNFVKANIAFEDKNYDFALNNYEYIINNYDSFFEAQASYLSTLVLLKKIPEAITYIDTLINDGYDRKELITYIEEKDENGNNIFDNLVQSKTYKTWKSKSN